MPYARRVPHVTEKGYNSVCFGSLYSFYMTVLSTLSIPFYALF